jgi:hypothetical protein
MVAEYKTVDVPQTTNRWVPQTTMRQVPRTVMMRVPITPTVPVCDTGCSYSTPVSSYSSSSTPYAEPIRTIPTAPMENYTGPTIESSPTTSYPETTEPTPATGPITSDDQWRPRAPVLEFGPSARGPQARSARANEGGWRAVATKGSTDRVRLSKAE